MTGVQIFKCGALSWVFVTFFKLYKWCQIVQSITNGQSPELRTGNFTLPENPHSTRNIRLFDSTVHNQCHLD